MPPLKTIVPILLLFALNSPCHGQAEWDKTLHFVGGNLFGMAGAGIAKQASKGNRVWTFAGALMGSALIGVAKEAVDSGQRVNGWDNDDLAATLLGGATMGLTIELFSKKDANRKLRGRYSPVPLPQIAGHSLPLAPRFGVREGILPTLNSLGSPRELLAPR